MSASKPALRVHPKEIHPQISLLTSQRTIRSPPKDLKLLFHGLPDGHKPLLTLRIHNDMFLLRRNLGRHASQRRKMTMSAKVSLGWESDENFCQPCQYFSRYLYSAEKRPFVKFLLCDYGIRFFKFQPSNIIQDLTIFSLCGISFIVIQLYKTYIQI